MAKYHQGIFRPSHPEKYIGRSPITWRSSWELTLMRVLDSHPSVINWASESIQIPYKDPFNKWRIYVPDFFIVYVDKFGRRHGEVIEIKPMSQTILLAAKSKKDKLAVAVNTSKWLFAKAWCKNQGLEFRIMTEQQLFQNMSAT